MRDTTIAGRYARALFIITEKRKETERALEDLKSLWEVLRPGMPAGKLLATPQVPLVDKRKVLTSVLEGRTAHSVMLFVDLLLRKHRLGDFELIVGDFEALVEAKQGIKRARVVSAVPLTRDEVERVRAQVERATGATIKLTAAVEPSLLGGALVHIGDLVIDRTVKTLLERIEQQLMEATV